ncbi:hypothetical protein THRCLA_09143 [Thraustotheca clavata]|uniref:Zinc finger PHD-type domain-containing protein n=1 Tax=Thraustotheca clavata TaxID=74557 RepID=A0A1V9YZ53_9STRA|nr:hypothetical protein THRCLA_09143 [Thraustotheca clavata]
MKSIAQLPPAMDGDVYFDKPASDLRFRTLEPSVFDAQLHLEAPTRPFLYTRKFVVASGTQFKVRTIEGRCNHPEHIERDLSQPDDRVMRKLLDLIEIRPLTAPNASPKYSVRVRWSKGPDTWMDFNMIPYQRTPLLQELLVATVHSWRVVRMIRNPSWKEYKTELELWSKDPAVRAYRSGTTTNAEESKENLNDKETPSKRQKRSPDKPIQVTQPPQQEKRNQRTRSRNFTDINNSIAGVRLSTLVPGASNDIVVITLIDDSDEEENESFGQIANAISDIGSSERIAQDQSTRTEQALLNGSTNSDTLPITLIKKEQGEEGSADIAVGNRPVEHAIESVHSNTGNTGTSSPSIQEDINQDMEDELSVESPSLPSPASWSPGSNQVVSSASSDYNEESEANSPLHVQLKNDKKSPSPAKKVPAQNVVKASAQDEVKVPALNEVKAVVKSDVNNTSSGDISERVNIKSQATIATGGQTIKPELKVASNQIVDNNPNSTLDMKEQTKFIPTEIVKRKEALWGPVLEPKPRFGCPCGVTKRMKAFSNWVVCRTKDCNTWMHRACNEPNTFYCQKCSGETELSPRAFNCAVWQLSALNESDRLGNLIKSTSRKVDISFQHQNLSCLSVAVVAGAMKTFALLIRIPAVEEIKSHVDPFSKNLLHLAIDYRKLAIAEYLVKNISALLVPCNIYMKSPMQVLVKSVPLVAQGFLEKYPSIRYIVDDTKNNWAHYVSK